MKRGFTLAEVLVTLMIIGVVAMITVPAILSSFEKHTWEAGIKKAYNSLSEAVELFMAEDGASQLSSSSLTTKEGLRSFVHTYFRVVKDCDGRYYNPNGNSCFAKELYSMNKANKANTTGYQCAVTVNTADGMSLCFDTGAIDDVQVDTDVNGDGVVDEKDKAHSAWEEGHPAALVMEVDVNGPKGPNIGGRDIFYMDVLDNGVVTDVKYDASKRQDIIDNYTKNAGPMPIGVIQADGWKMTY